MFKGLRGLFSRKKEDNAIPRTDLETSSKDTIKSEDKDNEPITSNDPYERLDSKIDKILSTLNEHDVSVKMKFDMLELNTETMTHLIKGLKAFEKLSGIETKVIERTRQELYVHRNKLYEQEVLNTINDMVLRNEPTFASNITERLIPRTIGSKQTLYKVLKKLIEKDALRKMEYGKFIKYVPSEMITEKETKPKDNA